MKNTTKTFFLITALYLFLTIPTFAVEPTLTPTKTVKLEREDKQGLKEEKQEFKNTIKETQQEDKTQKKQALSQLKKTRLENSFNRIKKELNTRLNYLTSMKTKIEARLNQKKAAGKDVSAAETKLKEFDTTAYTSDMTALDTQISQIMTVDKPASLMPQLRAAVNKVRTDLNNLHKVLVDSLRLIVRS